MIFLDHRKRLWETKTGFTLIELLVVIGIIILLTGGVIAGYSRHTERQRLLSEAKKLKTNLRRTQARAISGYKPGEISGISTPCDDPDKKLDYYYIVFGDTHYNVGISCDTDSDLIETVQLPNGIEFEPRPDPLIFEPLTRGMNLLVSRSFTLKNISTGYMATISANSNGDISGP